MCLVLVVFYVVDVVSIAVTLLLWICIGALVGKQESKCVVAMPYIPISNCVYKYLAFSIEKRGRVDWDDLHCYVCES